MYRKKITYRSSIKTAHNLEHENNAQCSNISIEAVTLCSLVKESLSTIGLCARQSKNDYQNLKYFWSKSPLFAYKVTKTVVNMSCQWCK